MELAESALRIMVDILGALPGFRAEVGTGAFSASLSTMTGEGS